MIIIIANQIFFIQQDSCISIIKKKKIMMLYSSFVMNTLKKIPRAATDFDIL